MRLFIRDFRDFDDIEKLNTYLSKELKLESDSLSIKEAMLSLTTAASIGLDIFLIISLLGSFLLLGVFSYSAYIDDKKESSILSCLGANKMQIINIFASESLTVSFLAFLTSTVLSSVIQKPLCILLDRLIGIHNLIDIPFST